MHLHLVEVYMQAELYITGSVGFISMLARSSLVLASCDGCEGFMLLACTFGSSGTARDVFMWCVWQSGILAENLALRRTNVSIHKGRVSKFDSS